MGAGNDDAHGPAPCIGHGRPLSLVPELLAVTTHPGARRGGTLAPRRQLPGSRSTAREGTMWKGMVVGVYIAADARGPMVEVQEVRAVPGRGLEGDRYWSGTGTYWKPSRPDREATLIEIEALEALMRDYDIALPPELSRRNIVTRGVPLNHLVTAPSASARSPSAGSACANPAPTWRRCRGWRRGGRSSTGAVSAPRSCPRAPSASAIPWSRWRGSTPRRASGRGEPSGRRRSWERQSGRVPLPRTRWTRIPRTPPPGGPRPPHRGPRERHGRRGPPR